MRFMRGRSREPKYFVTPENRRRNPGADPGGWRVKKGPKVQSATTVQRFENKRQAAARAKELARKNETTLRVFDAAMKTSDPFDYR